MKLNSRASDPYGNLYQFIREQFLDAPLSEIIRPANRAIKDAAKSPSAFCKFSGLHWLAGLLSYATEHRLPYSKVLAPLDTKSLDSLFRFLHQQEDYRHVVNVMECLVQADTEGKPCTVGLIRYLSPDLLSLLFSRTLLFRRYSGSRLLHFWALFNLFMPSPAELDEDPELARETSAFLQSIGPECNTECRRANYYNEYAFGLIYYIRFMPPADAERVLKNIGAEDLSPEKLRYLGIHLSAADRAFIDANLPAPRLPLA